MWAVSRPALSRTSSQLAGLMDEDLYLACAQYDSGASDDVHNPIAGLIPTRLSLTLLTSSLCNDLLSFNPAYGLTTPRR